MSALKKPFLTYQSSNTRAVEPITIFIADDSLELRTGLGKLLKRGRKFQVIGEAADGSEAVWDAVSLRPQVMLIKAGLTGADGANVIETMKELLPSCKLIALVDPAHDSDIYTSLAAGADGCCVRKLSIDTLKTAIFAVSRGSVWNDPAVRHCLERASTSEVGQPEVQGKAAERAGESSTWQGFETVDESFSRYARYYRPRWYHQRKVVAALHWVLVVIFTALIVLSTGSVVKAVLNSVFSNTLQDNKLPANSLGPTAPIPGMAYTLFELQCRTWHRYRGKASFDL